MTPILISTKQQNITLKKKKTASTRNKKQNNYNKKKKKKMKSEIPVCMYGSKKLKIVIKNLSQEKMGTHVIY